MEKRKIYMNSLENNGNYGYFKPKNGGQEAITQ